MITSICFLKNAIILFEKNRKDWMVFNGIIF
jgi:hypothetical protein